ncbi:MAG: DNA mismatch repair endonuclease MutL [Chloroflexi bacterium]|nr:DNA mismatch repair endonuclease MutL [Chloroflexota bacterium]
MPIRILTDEVASQIAAGEVVERPASVVKELMENSLDAHAGEIRVQISEAGRRLIEVSDDGVGIPINEMELAVARHATSKLSSADDLFRIQTLGFRGEALASIASVSRFTLVSRAQGADVGGRLRVEGGQVFPLEQVGVPPGTVVRVEELFYNVPARLKFLKRDSTERQQIEALVTRYALAYPGIRFHLFRDGKPVLQSTGRGDQREVLASLYGIEIARQMLEVSFEDDYMRVSGFISPVALTRSNRKEITFFVKGRWVQDSSLSAALLQAYHTLLMVGRYPLAALFIDLPSEEVDVNVHPAKAEVRFRSPDKVFSGVQRAVRRALLAYSPVPPVFSAPRQGSMFPSRTIDPAWEMPREADSHARSWSDSLAPDTFDTGGRDDFAEAPQDELSEDAQMEAVDRLAAVDRPVDQAELPSGALPLLRLIGQVGLTYLIAEGPDGLYLIDQHAAHERVLFERFMRQRSASIPAQALLEPATIQLPPASANLLEEQLDLLEKLGFRIEPFGPNTFLIRAIPALLSGADAPSAVRVVVEDFEEDEAPLQAEIEAKIIARVCKRAAVKAGQALSPEEQRVLLRDLEACSSPRTCPHGRPTMIHLSVDLLERQFGR